MKFHSAVPLEFWGHCLLTAEHVLNRTPSIQLNGCTPYELLLKEQPVFSEMRVFGCLNYVTVVPHPTNKFAPRAVKGVFVGYPFGKEEFKVFDFQTKQVFVSRDVVFYKNIFLFKEIITPSLQQLFPDSSNFVDCDPLSLTHTPTSLLMLGLQLLHLLKLLLQKLKLIVLHLFRCCLIDLLELDNFLLRF